MSLSALPLSYCTNVHPGRSLAEVEAGLERYTVPVMGAYGQPLAAGLWLARPVVTQLLQESPEQFWKFAERFWSPDLSCHTLNAFPYGDFHGERVKEKVYLPDWTTNERLLYTLDCAEVLTRLLRGEKDGSISTLPLGFREFRHPPGFLAACAAKLIECAQCLAEIQSRLHACPVRLAIEPEPFCRIETTSDVIDFFHLLWRQADRQGATDVVRQHIGVCFDVCHQAVEYEDVAESIRRLDSEGIRINKVHLSCALQLDDPRNNAAGRAALRRYVEPRYLHQTIAMAPGGRQVRAVDLTHELVDSPSEEFLSAPSWRVHFHVPVDAERIGPLATTRGILRQALGAIAKLNYAPHLEVETYTWEVLPGEGKPDLVTGLTRELTATRELLAEVGGDAKMPAAIRD